MTDSGRPNPDYSRVTAIEERALRSDGNGFVPWGDSQTELWSERLGNLQAPTQAPKTALNLFVSLPSLLQARPSIDTVL